MIYTIAQSKNIFKPIHTCVRGHKVTVLGAATEIGQTVSLLLRGQTNITNLVLHDVPVHTKGILLDISHVPINAAVQAYTGEDTLSKAMENSEIIISAGGMLQKPGITEYQWLSMNAGYIKYIAKALSGLTTNPIVGFVTNPLNRVLPMTVEIMKNQGNCDPKKLFGVTSIDALRAQSLYAAERNMDPRTVIVPVIGGHSNTTTVPLLSQVQPTSKVTEPQAREFTTKFRCVDDNIISAKKGAPVLSIAYSALVFTRSVLAALDGKPATVNAYVENNDFGTEYFSGMVHIDAEGAKGMQTYSNLSKYECDLLEKSIEKIREDVMQGKKILECA